MLPEISPVPVLVVHGDADLTVAYDLGEEVFKRLKEPKEFLRVSDGRHTDFLWREKGEYREKFLGFLRKASARRQQCLPSK